MDARADAGPCWTTSAFGRSADTSPMELVELGEHLQQCQAGSRRLGHLHRAAQAVHGFVAPRFVSTLAVVAVLGGAVFLIL